VEPKILHDLSLQQLRDGWAGCGIDGFYFSTFWYLKLKDSFKFVLDVARAGGLKNFFGIPDKVIYCHGADRILGGKSYFFRSPLAALGEAVVFRPDVIQVYDVPLKNEDDGKIVLEKLAVNRDIVLEYNRWLVRNGFRSKACFRGGLPKFSAFMLLGVVHGDSPEAYALEAKFMKKYCEVLGVPVGGYTIKQKYNRLLEVLKHVFEVASDRVIQLMGFGVSNLRAVTEILGLARKYNAYLWFEGSSIVRNSAHARKLLSLNLKKGELNYVNFEQVKGFNEEPTCLNIFRYNDRVLRGILKQITLKLET